MPTESDELEEFINVYQQDKTGPHPIWMPVLSIWCGNSIILNSLYHRMRRTYATRDFLVEYDVLAAVPKGVQQ